ncbi:PB1 domain-containing protein tyrosine kinase [Rhynchospora pubera]|uniref:PB1 domain-containing protein tyrosine kinase n=1 Tax=Rhynchospora pubera TaxID=906938 RepID=A0AAV8CQJ0_9POAL|nr:PB1 domain-containing protein tyrosine kinase [Rhynchospora pubera]
MATSGGGATTSDGADLRPAKLLCSLGGRILPRPSDGALRYAGGDTRIISLPRNSTLALLLSKLCDAYTLSSPFLLRYQLPDEGLDSLISVSTQEDLDNMMEEYDKLTGASPKLRVFLFPLSDPGLGAEVVDQVDSDINQRYVDAVNGVNGLNRKDSIASLASVSVSSPNSSISNDASRTTFITAPLIDVDIEKGNPNPSPNLLEFSNEGKESAKYRQPLSQLPPLPPAFLINSNINNNSNCNSKEREGEHIVYSNDCNLCQRQLPHAHSDTLVGELSDGKVGFAPEPLPIFHSLRPEDISRIMAQPIPNYGYGQFYPVPENTPQVPQYPFNAETAYPHDAGFIKPVHVNHVEPIGVAESVKSVIPDPPLAAPVSPATYSSFAPVHYQSIQTPNMSHLPMMNGPYLYHVESGPVPNHGVNPVYASRAVNVNLVSEQKDVCASGTNLVSEWKEVPSTSQQKEHHNDLVMPISGNAATVLSGSVEQMQETVLLDPKLQGTSHALPPRPKRVASRDSISPKEPVNTKGLDLNVPVEESGLQNLSDDLTKEPVFEPVRYVKDGFFSQDLQKIEEGVIASQVLTDNQTDSSNAKEILDLNGGGTTTLGESPSTETTKSKPVDLINFGLPKTEDLGRLQIIRNSDLEELTELGSGTFGTVYHGKWRGSDVAIKRINDRCFAGKPSEQEKMRADFWNEASKLADLHHPNVVAFYGVVLDGPGGSIATVTEFMVNGSLRHALQRNDKSLDLRRRLIIAMDAAFGMEYLHSKNIVHFDLKSDNLLVNLRDSHRPICKVGDLGLSKVKCQTLISGGVRGTLPWMAPELLNGSSSLVSEKVDVFSFGIVLWELLTGEEPYADLHYGVIIGGIVSNTLRPQVPESCDPEWRSLMEQCWSSEPSDRPSFPEIVSRLRSMATLPQKTS